MDQTKHKDVYVRCSSAETGRVLAYDLWGLRERVLLGVLG